MGEIAETSVRVTKNAIDSLAEKTGSVWTNVAEARRFTQQYRNALGKSFSGLDTGDTSIVVFGSLARDEATPGSDTDWTLLIDGIADPQHLNTAHEIEKRLDDFQGKAPGREGTFGNVAFSHEILHWIGG